LAGTVIAGHITASPAFAAFHLAVPIATVTGHGSVGATCASVGATATARGALFISVSHIMCTGVNHDSFCAFPAARQTFLLPTPRTGTACPLTTALAAGAGILTGTSADIATDFPRLGARPAGLCMVAVGDLVLDFGIAEFAFRTQGIRPRIEVGFAFGAEGVSGLVGDGMLFNGPFFNKIVQQTRVVGYLVTLDDLKAGLVHIGSVQVLAEQFFL
jgi:hypothetical protein